MSKSLCDWTLGEVQNYVKGIKDCCKCVFYNGTEVCPFIECPVDWKVPAFTLQEGQDAKALLRMLPECDQVHRDGVGQLYITGNDVPSMILLNENMFPSIKKGQTIKLADIAGVIRG